MDELRTQYYVPREDDQAPYFNTPFLSGYKDFLYAVGHQPT